MARRRSFAPGDVLAALVGGVVGVGLGYIVGNAVGRVNSRRISGAMQRWRERRAVPRVWTEEEAERLEWRVLDALSGDVVLARRPIRVAVAGMGLVELTGTVERAPQVRLARHAVQRGHGVGTV